MPTDREILKAQVAGALAGTACTDPVATAKVAASHGPVIVFTKASADSMAADTTAETYTGLYFPRACRIRSLYIITTAAGLTAHASNYATITVSKRNAAAGGKTTVGTLTTTVVSSGNLTQGVGTAFVLSTTAGALDLVAGGSLTWEIAKAASGVIVPACVVCADIEWV